eukprot:1841274-Amphidinium_carterae.1
MKKTSISNTGLAPFSHFAGSFWNSMPASSCVIIKVFVEGLSLHLASQPPIPRPYYEILEVPRTPWESIQTCQSRSCDSV